MIDHASNKTIDTTVFNHITKRQPCTTVSDIIDELDLLPRSIDRSLARLKRAGKVRFSVDHHAWMTTEDHPAAAAEKLAAKGFEHVRQLRFGHNESWSPTPDLNGLVEVIRGLHEIVKKGAF
jgi:hypothetical protein